MAPKQYQYEEGFIGPSQARSPDWDQINAHIKEFDQTFAVVIDYRRQARNDPNRPRDQALHYERCNDWADFFEDYTYAELIYWYFRPGSTQADLDERVDELKARCTERTLIMFYFNGKSTGKNKGYMWKIPGIRGNINAYNLMTTMNKTTADIVWYLDCWAQTRWRPKFKRNGYMTEIICAGPSEPDRNFNYTQVHQGDFVKGFTRMMKKYLEGPGCGVFSGETKMQSTPMIMRWDNTLSNNATRVWVNKPCKKDRWMPGKEIYRIMIDPQLAWATGKYEFFGKQIQPRPDEEEPWEPEDLGKMSDDDDEGYSDSEAAANYIAGYSANQQDDTMDTDSDDDSAGDSDHDTNTTSNESRTASDESHTVGNESITSNSESNNHTLFVTEDEAEDLDMET